jgi:hypothetical protein
MKTTTELRKEASYEVSLVDGSRLWIIEAPGYPGGFKVLGYLPEKELHRTIEHCTKGKTHLKTVESLMQLSGPYPKYEPTENSPVSLKLQICEGDPLVEVFSGMTDRVINLRRQRNSGPAPR